MKIFKYFLTIALVTLVISLHAEEKKTKPPKAEKYWHETGLRLGFDVTRPLQGLWTKGDRWGLEFTSDLEISPDVFVVAEGGWEQFGITQPHVDYSSNGAYLRLGVDYNLLHVSTESNDKSTLYIGARYGFGPSVQTVNSYSIDNYWGIFEGSFGKQSYFSHWGEFVFGMKTEVLKNFYLGWSVRLKFLFGQSKLGTPPAYFSAGYGANDSGAVFDFNYTLMYSLPFNIGKRHSAEEKAELKEAQK
ncbi:MAG: DUF6048 family protein [Mangrovibacterium sp.]